MKPFKSLISLEEARKIINNSIEPIDRKEEIGIERAHGRVLSRGVNARFDVPGFDRAAMDGYAVKAEDTFGATQLKPKKLKLVGVVEAGETTHKIIGGNECIQIATGACLPKGTNAVVMIEDTEKNDTVKIFKPVYPGANVSVRGEDVKRGEIVLKEGEVLDPSRIGALAAVGKAKVQVYERPRVRVISTGKEIVRLGEKLGKSQVYDVNSYTLSSTINNNGGRAVTYGLVEDRFEDIKNAIENTINNDAIVISGGSSVGERDLLFNVIHGLGKILFHGVQVKPGKPLLFGEVQGKPVFGMSGFPTSCLILAYVFLLPAVRRIARLPPKEEETRKAKISKRIVSSLGRHQFLPVKISKDKAIPVFKESGAITSIANADGYLELPPNVDLVEKGEEIVVKLYR